MPHPDIDGLHSLLQGPAVAPFPAALRDSLLRAWEAEGTDRSQRESWAVIADTLRILGRLEAN